MAIFYVLTPPVVKNPEKDTLFVEDRFSWAAFLFPLPWLLVKRMWLVAALAVALYLVCVIVAEQWRLDGLPMAFSLILSLWTSLEGNHVRARMLQMKGWDLQTEIAADDLEDAEDVYFSSLPSSTAAQPIDKMYAQPPHRGMMALGLIGPYGDR
jgi:hypothetical protein